MELSPSNSDKLKTKYEAIIPLYQELIEEIQFTLEKKLKVFGVKLAAIEGRVKKIDSVLQKIQRKKYKDPLSEIDDFAGVRLVCLFSPDLDIVSEVVESLFEITEAEDKTDALGLERMGYQGKHFIVRLGTTYQGLRDDDLINLRAEIQVRTILQDAWAQLNHNQIYKNEASFPDKILRELNNVSSLLEIAQNIFDRSRDTRTQYIRDVESLVNNQDEFLLQPIDRETVEAYTKWKFPNLPVKQEIQDLLLRDIDYEKFRSLQDIDRALKAAMDVVESYRKENPDLFQSGTDYITKSLGFVDQHFRKKHPFGSKTRKSFDKFTTKLPRGRS
jgi:putative GTP pyrophosphokinase